MASAYICIVYSHVLSFTGFHTFPLIFQVKEILYFIWSLFYCRFFNKELLARVLHFVMLQVVSLLLQD